MKRGWAIPIPLHLAADDYSADACELRLHLYQFNFTRMRGKGFRVAPGTSPKRKNPRHGRGREFSRIDSMYLTQRYGERT